MHFREMMISIHWYACNLIAASFYDHNYTVTCTHCVQQDCLACPHGGLLIIVQ